jgi:hypothetical protein
MRVLYRALQLNTKLLFALLQSLLRYHKAQYTMLLLAVLLVLAVLLIPCGSEPLLYCTTHNCQKTARVNHTLSYKTWKGKNERNVAPTATLCMTMLRHYTTTACTLLTYCSNTAYTLLTLSACSVAASCHAHCDCYGSATVRRLSLLLLLLLLLFSLYWTFCEGPAAQLTARVSFASP